jgi:hypothetical protein
MYISSNLASHFKAVFTGGNWTTTNLKETLSDVSFQQANVKLQGLNSIVALVYHINYFVDALEQVLEGKQLEAHDKFSFDHPLISSQEEWKFFVQEVLSKAEKVASLISALPDERLSEHFFIEKYGSYYRNLTGVIEHTHYHLGQIVIIKKLITSNHI